MKERIIIEIPKDMCDNCNSCDKPISAQIECYLKEERQVYETVKVPENWKELKELCINLKRDYDITCVSSTIWVHGLSFNETGIIGDSHHSFIVEDKTPAQMWNIIKNLIGEE